MQTCFSGKAFAVESKLKMTFQVEKIQKLKGSQLKPNEMIKKPLTT